MESTRRLVKKIAGYAESGESVDALKYACIMTCQVFP